MPGPMVQSIDVEKIDPSPFQLRQYIDEDRLRELALSIQRDGLIEPVVLRPFNGRYQLIAGERRLRAVKEHTDLKFIEAKVMTANDLEALRIAAAENLQREDLSAIEMIESTVALVDAELIHDKEYALMGDDSKVRVKTLLERLKATQRSKERGFNPNSELKHTTHKFMRRIDKIFKNLPKPLKWRSFYENDLPLIVHISQDVQELAIRNRLNCSQIRALEKLRSVSKQEFHRVTNDDQEAPGQEERAGETKTGRINLRELGAGEIEDMAQKAARKENVAEFHRTQVRTSSASQTMIFMMSRLGIPMERTASRLKRDRRTIKRYAENPNLVRAVQNEMKKGRTVEQAARDLDCPEPLVWSLALEGKDDLARFRELGWGIRTWDLWNWNDCDRRFGDDWPGRIPAQMIGHILFYFSDQDDLIFDPMAGGGVVPDTCLALNRKCWSFDMADRPYKRPEIEPWYWDPNNLQWPVKGKVSTDLILFDPPYFRKKAEGYDENSISGLSRDHYLEFLGRFFRLACENSARQSILALINADWRDFQSTPARNEVRGNSILVHDYTRILDKGGWETTHIILAPMSSERFQAGTVAAMQKKRILGVTSRYIIIAKHRL